LDALEESLAGRFVLGYDTRLLRRVWIHKLLVGTPPISAERRNMGRVGRLRWINGRRDAKQAWDVYEALSGKPLLRLLDSPQPWSIVRYWLLDLAEELRVASKDGTLPNELGLDRVWITGEGRAKLLDFPAPGTSRETAKGEAPTNHAVLEAAKFLPHVACAALKGNAQVESVTGPPAVPLPFEARELLTQLPTADDLGAICERLKSAVRKTPEVTRKRRLAMLCATAGFPLFIAIFSMVGAYLTGQTGRISPVVMALIQFVFIWLMFVAIPGLVAAILFGRGMIMTLFGVRCVTRTGERASRLRMLWRTIVFHAPIVLATVAAALVNPLVQQWAPGVFAMVGVVLLALVVWSLVLPTRGIADRLAGTFPVPS
jgi:hypothetical protein